MNQAIPLEFTTATESYIDDEAAFQRFISETEALGEFHACAIDTEADSMHSYETKLCLIQLAVPGKLAVLDPLAFSKEMMDQFMVFIDRFEVVWMHGADYDISLFNTTFNWAPQKIYDTQVAARLLGVDKFGLANLLEAEYEVKLSKQSQKADWSRRPLSAKMLEYAYNDVRFLLDLGERYLQRLEHLGRLDWFLESCAAARDAVLMRSGKSSEDLWRINGWGRLSSKGLHLLQHLWQWRDEECRRLDRPAFKFLGNHELLSMAAQLEAGNSLNIPHYLRPGPVRRLYEILDAARDIDPKNYPVKYRRGEGPRLDVDESRMEEIRRARDTKAAELGIEATVIATRLTMEKLAATNLPDEGKKDLLLSWQRELLASVL